MTFWVFLLLALAGGVGAAVRFLVDGLIRSRLKTTFQWATTIINVSGSLVLGLLTGLTMERVVPTDLSIVIGTGFLGGYTTFSTASYETVQLIKQGRYGASFISGVVMLVFSVAAAVLGLWIGASL
ncbi:MULTISPECIES: fluoride efflux transporter CrcB [Arthrobacter]|uniref:Fluoride-specific ion channel FluC n=1 Tax=Arthrobacter caoxuetaonis TaxID=2886935 RepID=A0A9X1MHQ6_9MICC|nr:MULTISPECIES: fluoride efflux transporter CrcB [Arthrobacter]MCC3283736.1 fluoride efflux transporter CrcB [Arthrobacter caoxuetaonis]MCC3299122.1 fluoride efflux transporter CrcB [Arthrobacter caoxuetaonis]MCC9193173.1 fluoride efflux transporter CrcB [Arthrobacter sp. zg-Y916]USQ58546.1 fluoride efflux transporter CrcB [Arthrobacter caoxuetaonis]